MLRHLAKRKGESIVHSGNGSQVEPAAADPTNLGAEYVNNLVHQSTMDLLHDVADEFTKLVDGVNEDFNKSFDIFDA